MTDQELDSLWQHLASCKREIQANHLRNNQLQEEYNSLLEQIHAEFRLRHREAS